MRDLSSNRIRGYEAVLSAALSWWAKQNPLDPGAVRESLASADAASVCRRDELSLGSSLSGPLGLDGRAAAFWAEAGRNPALRHMLEEAVSSWRLRNGGTKVEAARKFVADLIVREAGRAAKESGILEERAEELRAARRRRK